MNPELFKHYGTQIRKKSKRVYRKSLKLVIVSKNGAITTIQTTTHYCREMRLQAKVFRANFNHDFNRFNQSELWK